MRNSVFALLLLVGLSACDQDPVSTDDRSFLFDEAASLGFGASFAGDPGTGFVPMVLRLPDHLKLSSQQEAQVRALIEQFAANTRSQREALAGILRQAYDARQAGKPDSEVRTILQQGEPIRQQLVAAEQKLRADLFAVLTAEQKAWIQAHEPRPCNATLTESQRVEISALYAAFEQNNRADLDVIRTALEQARAAQRNGATQAEVREILTRAQPAMERVRLAQVQLSVAVAAVLTPAQNSCFLRDLPRRR